MVRNGITRSAVEQAVVASGRPGRDVGTFEQQGLDTPERAVSGDTCPGRSAADDDDIVGLVHRLDGLCYHKNNHFHLKTKENERFFISFYFDQLKTTLTKHKNQAKTK